MASVITKWLGKLAQAARDPQYRSLVWLRRMRPELLHQTTPFTARDRYPDIFREAAAHLSGSRDATVLSFGCATGEEVLSLADYMPHARIVAADINSGSLSIARRRARSTSAVFVNARGRGIEQHAPYDAIFAMAVFQRTPHLVLSEDVTDISTLYPFARFEAEISRLVGLLKPSGIFVIEHAFYSIRDVAAARHLRPVYEREVPVSSPAFHPDGRRAALVQRHPVIFRAGA